MSIKRETKELKERVITLLEEQPDFTAVALMLGMTPEELRKKLLPYTPASWYPYIALVKLYRQFIPVQIISRKAGVSIGAVIGALKKYAGYVSFAEHFRDVKFKDLAQQAAFCKDRDRLIALYYKRGWTIGDLETEFELPEHFLRQVLKEAGFKFEDQYQPFYRYRSRGNETEIRNEKIYDDFRAGDTMEELCEKYKLTERTVDAVIKAKQKKYFPLLGKKKNETYKTESKIKFRKKI